MQFSNTTDRSGLIQEAEFLTGIGDGQISGNTTNLQTFTRLMNSRYHQVATMILKAKDEWDFDDPNHNNTGFVKTYNLVGDTQTVELPVSDKILKIKKAEITYDGTTWKPLNPLDIAELETATDSTTIASNFSTSEPYYDVHGKYVYLYPVPTVNVTGGLKLWVTREIDEFTSADTTQEPGFDEPFHRMLAIGASLDWAVAKGLTNKNDLAALYQDYEARLTQYYGGKQEHRQFILKGQYVDYE